MEGGVDPSKSVVHPYVSQNARYLPGFSYPAPRELSSIIKFALLEREQPHHIRDIWLDYHDEREDCVADVLKEGEFLGFLERSRKWPNFLYPVRKGPNQFYMLFAQWQGKHCILTFLEHYRKNPATAEPYMAVTLYEDLIDRKQLVLVRGDYSAHLTKKEAERLMELIRHFYLHEPGLVQAFNETPDEFDFNRFIAECP